MNHGISGESVAMIEKEFQNAIKDLNESIRDLNASLKRTTDNFSDLKNYWNTEGSVSVLNRLSDVSKKISLSQRNIRGYCDVILSSVGNQEMLNFDSDIVGVDYE